MRRVFFPVFLLSIMLASCGNKELTISESWARTGTTGGNSAIYLIIDNPTNQDDVLLSASSSVAVAVELHMSKMTDEGTMMMQQQENIPVPMGTKVELRPGGLHIMLINLNKDLVEGSSFQVVLNFQNAGEITIEIPVKNP